MKHQETILIESETVIDLEIIIRIGNMLEQHGLDARLVDLDLYSLMKCKKLLTEEGASYLLSLERIQEAVLPKVEKVYLPLLVELLRDHLERLAPSQELIIIDPYFLVANPSEKKDYLDTFREVFASTVPSITRITFITLPSYDQALYDAMERMVVEINAHIAITHKTTRDFHDRFWIVDRCKGLYIGTSLNGIGKRYALVDYLQGDDVKTIVEELQTLNLL